MPFYHVAFFVDGDYGVETFAEVVEARDPSRAYDLAVKNAKDSGCTSTGRALYDSDWENATEIACLDLSAWAANPPAPTLKPEKPKKASGPKIKA